MDPKIAPTSPKYSQKQSVEKLYAEHSSGLQQPPKRVPWIPMLLLVVLFGVTSGAVGMALLNSLYQQHPSWPFWKTLRLNGDAAEEQTREVIIRETGTTDRIDQERQELYDRVNETLLSVYQKNVDEYAYLGTGALLTTDGVFLYDGAQGGSEVTDNIVAVTASGNEFPVTIRSADPLTDLSFGKIDGQQFSVLSFGSTADLHFGQTLYSLSANYTEGPARMRVTSLQALNALRTENTSPILESSDAIGRNILIEPPSDWVAGSILIDHSGALQGIALDENLQSSVIPVVLIRSALQTYSTLGKITRSTLGVHGYDLSNSLGLPESRTNQQREGFLLSGTEAEPAVLTDSPADQAGLADGDILTAINGQKLDRLHSLAQIVQTASIGSEISVEYLRDGAKQQTQVTLRGLSE